MTPAHRQPATRELARSIYLLARTCKQGRRVPRDRARPPAATGTPAT